MVKQLKAGEVSGSRERKELFSQGIPLKKNGDDDEVKVKKKKNEKFECGQYCPQSEGGAGNTNINIMLIDPRQSTSPQEVLALPPTPNPPGGEKGLKSGSQALRYGIVAATVVCIVIGTFWIWSHYQGNCDSKLEQQQVIHNFTLDQIKQAQLLKDQQRNITKEKDDEILALRIKLERLSGHVDVFRNQTLSSSDTIEGQRVVNNHLFEEMRKMEELIGRLEREKIELIGRHVKRIRKAGESSGGGGGMSRASSSYLRGVVLVLLLHIIT